MVAELEKYDPELRQRLTPVIRDLMLGYIASLIEQTSDLGQRVIHQRPGTGVEDLQSLSGYLEGLEILLQTTEAMVKQRRSPEGLAILGDADALAEACYRPILEFAHQHQIPIASNHPMTFFQPGGTSIELAFLPFQLAPIALPNEFRAQPWRWPAIAHEIAHDFIVSIEGLPQEFAAHLGLGKDEEAPAGPLEAGTRPFHVALHRIWLDEMLADAIGALMIGPAYLRAMTAIFELPESPVEVASIVINRAGSIDPHPPRHLRVQMTGRFLDRMGFGARSRQIVEAWDQRHGTPDAMWILTERRQVRIPLEPMLQFGDELMDRLYQAEIQSLAGHRLADIPGLEYSTTHERRAEVARDSLASGQPAAFDARSLIAAATEASLDHPDRVAAINQAARLSIVGVGTGERPARVRALASRAGAGPARAGGSESGRLALPLARRRIVEAILLGELLERKTSYGSARFS